MGAFLFAGGNASLRMSSEVGGGLFLAVELSPRRDLEAGRGGPNWERFLRIPL